MISMVSKTAMAVGALALLAIHPPNAACEHLSMPSTVQAGRGFSVESSGSGKAVLYIVGPGQALRRDVQLGEATFFPDGALYSAGRYLAVLNAATGTASASFDVVPASNAANLSFLAKPSRLPVGLHNGITGAVYIFDAYNNLISTPITVSFGLSNAGAPPQTRSVLARDGAASTELDSTAKVGMDQFVARAGGIVSTRIVEQVPGDPCGLRLSARRSGQSLQLETDPLRDCNGNKLPEGTIVTFTQNYNGGQTTVDVPLKHGVAQVQMEAHSGARISVASGVVMGNEVRADK